MDKIDRAILAILQNDVTMPVADIAKKVGLSTTPCWRRIQKLEEDKVISKRVAILNPEKVNVGVTAFAFIKTDRHSKKWAEDFSHAVSKFREVIAFHRLSGDIDYMLEIVVPDIGAYDTFYQKLISEIEIDSVTSVFAMETIKDTTQLPLNYIRLGEEG